LGLPTKSVFKNIKKHAVHNINILAWVPRAIAHRPQALVSFKKYMPPPLPYFKVNDHDGIVKYGRSREFRMHMKNPAQTGSDCIRFSD
jgi:hypothetical protein